MKLTNLKITNFRCYKETAEINLNDFTCIIGKNDSGKSTIFDALDIIFNDATIEQNDCNISNLENKVIEFETTFSDLQNKIILDSEFETSLLEEDLLNDRSMLQIKIKYDFSTSSKAKSSYYVYSLYPLGEQTKEIYTLNNQKLKSLARTNTINIDSIEDARVNSHIRKEIKNKFAYPKILTYIPIDDDKYKKIKELFPAIFIYKSDRASTDKDSEAKDPLEIVVKDVLATKSTELTQLLNDIQNEIEKLSNKTLEKLKEFSPDITNSISATLAKTPSWNSLFKDYNINTGEIPLNKRGSGIRRLVLLSFFRAKSENLELKSPNKNIVYCIEEPETGQHPYNQKMILDALLHLSLNRQIIITTHTPMLISNINTKDIKYTKQNLHNNSSIINNLTDADMRAICDDLGILPDSKLRMFIYVEGQRDIDFLKNISKKLIELGITDILDIENLIRESKIAFLPVDGSTLKYFINNSIGFNRSEFHLYDSDKTSAAAESPHKNIIDTINNKNTPASRNKYKAVLTTGRELENYLHFSVINRYFSMLPQETNTNSINLTEDIDIFKDVPNYIANLRYPNFNTLDEKTKKSKESVIKNHLANAAKFINIEVTQPQNVRYTIYSILKEIKTMFDSIDQ